jgi:hypothetical protein
LKFSNFKSASLIVLAASMASSIFFFDKIAVFLFSGLSELKASLVLLSLSGSSKNN